MERYVPAPCWVVTGPMASGKSTVAEALCHRFERSAHVRGDVFRRMIVEGRDPIAPTLGEEARSQLALRRRLAAMTADAYCRAGFTTVLQDVYVGEDLTSLLATITATPLYAVVLLPRPDVVAHRERTRAKRGYRDGWEVASHVADVERRVPDVGLRLDTSTQTPEETVTELLGRRDEALVRPVAP